jgi:hypothetical protein
VRRRSSSTGPRTRGATGDETFWELIDSLDWPSDKNPERIREEMLLWPQSQREAFELALSSKVFGLAERFKGVVPDGNLDQLMGEVVARGEDFYNRIDSETVRRFFRTETFEESFLYATDVEELF